MFVNFLKVLAEKVLLSYQPLSYKKTGVKAGNETEDLQYYFYFLIKKPVGIFFYIDPMRPAYVS